MLYNRREVGKFAVAALPAAHLLASSGRIMAAGAATKPATDFGGVKVGIVAPYAFRGTANNVDDNLKGMLHGNDRAWVSDFRRLGRHDRTSEVRRVLQGGAGLAGYDSAIRSPIPG